MLGVLSQGSLPVKPIKSKRWSSVRMKTTLRGFAPFISSSFRLGCLAGGCAYTHAQQAMRQQQNKASFRINLKALIWLNCGNLFSEPAPNVAIFGRLERAFLEQYA
jgi:hypothetical protein